MPTDFALTALRTCHPVASRRPRPAGGRASDRTALLPSAGLLIAESDIEPPSSKPVARPVHCEVLLMRVPQPLQRRHMVHPERLSSHFASVEANEHDAIVVETDEALVEGGVP